PDRNLERAPTAPGHVGDELNHDVPQLVLLSDTALPHLGVAERVETELQAEGGPLLVIRRLPPRLGESGCIHCSRTAVLVDEAGEGLKAGVHVALEDGEEQLLLVLEVRVDGN